MLRVPYWQFRAHFKPQIAYEIRLNFASLNRYRCYMLTLQALTHTEDPEYEPAGPFGTMPQEPWLPNRTRRNTKPVPWSSSHTAKCAPLQAGKQSEQWRASTTERNNSLHKDELSRVNLFTFELLDDFNFVLVCCILRFLFLKIRFGDKTGKNWLIWQEMEPFYIILDLKQNH